MNIEDLRFGGEDADCISESSERFRREREAGESYKVHLLANAMMAGADVVPAIWENVQRVAERLNVMEFDLFIFPDQNPQAMCLRIPSTQGGGNEEMRVCMALSAGLIRLFEPDEVSFVIGHELGHFLLGHHGYPSVESAKEPWQKRYLIELHHYAELSADRVGACACSDTEIGIRALIKLASGLPTKFLGRDVSSFITQLRTLESYTADGSLSASTHPLLPLRARNLVLFSQTSEFANWTGTGSASLSKADCDRAVLRSYGEISGAADAARRSLELAKFWGSLLLFSSDKKLSKAEQEWLKDRFGERLTSGGYRFIKAHASQVTEAIERKLKDVVDRGAWVDQANINSLRSTMNEAFDVAGGSEEVREQAIQTVLDRFIDAG